MPSRHQALCRAALSTLLGGAALWLSTSAADAEPVDRWADAIALASARFGIPADWIRQVMRVESGGATLLDGRPIVSRAGAMGLMQLMPGTWRDMRIQLGLGANPHDPADNIVAGTAYLRLMYDRFGYPGLFAAYNAGPARYAAWLSGEHRLPAETRAYVSAVAPASLSRRTMAAPVPTTPTLFALRPADALAPPGQSTRSGANLFVALSGQAAR